MKHKLKNNIIIQYFLDKFYDSFYVPRINDYQDQVKELKSCVLDLTNQLTKANENNEIAVKKFKEVKAENLLFTNQIYNLNRNKTLNMKPSVFDAKFQLDINQVMTAVNRLKKTYTKNNNK